MIKQRTLKTPVKAAGVGLHSGVKVEMTLRPAGPDTGIVFRRIDLDPVLELPARAEYVGDTTLSTTLVLGGERVATVEHVLADGVLGPAHGVADAASARFIHVVLDGFRVRVESISCESAGGRVEGNGEGDVSDPKQPGFALRGRATRPPTSSR